VVTGAATSPLPVLLLAGFIGRGSELMVFSLPLLFAFPGVVAVPAGFIGRGSELMVFSLPLLLTLPGVVAVPPGFIGRGSELMVGEVLITGVFDRSL
jgi:hypothetical protein